MEKREFITKMPGAPDIERMVKTLLGNDAGMVAETKEDMDLILEGHGLPRDFIAKGTFYRITIEEIA